EKRGVELDLTSVTVEFVEEIVFDDPELFACGYARSQSPSALIQMAQPCWDGYSEFDKEILMFHEFGHALLGRPHLDLEFSTGSQKSIMNSNPFRAYTEWSLIKRPYYLDELFDPRRSINIPEWAAFKSNQRLIYSNDMSSTDDWDLRGSNSSPFDSTFISGGTTSYGAAESVLSIESISNNGVFHYWRLELNDLNIDPNSGLSFRIKVAAEDLQGEGLFIFFRGDNADQTVRGIFSNNIDIVEQGSFDFRSIVLDIDYFSSGVDKVIFFMGFMSNTSGKVYFDDFELVELY
ncbi:MAG: hypothetical protein RIC80_22885, partial [Cyclobacteriaceae bacterium]